MLKHAIIQWLIIFLELLLSKTGFGFGLNAELAVKTSKSRCVLRSCFVCFHFFVVVEESLSSTSRDQLSFHRGSPADGNVSVIFVGESIT